MMTADRRSVLKALGSASLLGGVATAGARLQGSGNERASGRLRKRGHSVLSNPPGEYTEADVRPDGGYGVVGSYFGRGGSFLVDLDEPTNPTEVHQVPSSPDTRNAEVAFDPRDGLYYRTQEPNNRDGVGGVEVIDYGYESGSPEDPDIVAAIDAGHTHNVSAHPDPETPTLYTVNGGFGSSEPGLDVVDVSYPASPTVLGQFGPAGSCHDVVIDGERDLAHAAYIGGGLDGYVVLDTSDPAAPTEVGRYAYANEPNYRDVPLGEVAFENCHYANYDPERGLAYVGDEVATGKPGGKHVFDIGYDEGSPSDPVPIGFTLSPNAEVQEDLPTERLDWTGHNFDAIPRESTTLLVSADYHEGAVLYDVGDPTDPVSVNQYRTDDEAGTIAEDAGPGFAGLDAPMTWGMAYNATRDLAFAVDMVTGAYTFTATSEDG